MNGLRLGVGIALAVVAVSGCGPSRVVSGTATGMGTNGLGRESSAAVVQAAAAALRDAPSVRVNSAGSSAGRPVQLDLRIRGSNRNGSLTIGEQRIEIITLGEHVYLRAGDEQALTAMGLPAEVASLGSARWFQTSSGK